MEGKKTIIPSASANDDFNIISIELETQLMLLNLREIPTESVNQFGTKASALGKLAQNNVNVPEGYVLSNEVFTSYLKFNNFRFSPNMFLSHNDEIQNFLINGEFPHEIIGKLVDIYNKLTFSGKSSVAVRSSSTYEDNEEYSMAGVFESFVNIKSYIEFERSIKKCYASYFSDKALAMMLRRNIKFDDVRMGVVLQRFIEGDISGVLFTADTISMDENIIVINAVGGLCRGLVDGTKKSSYYRVNKYNGRILASEISPDTSEIKEGELSKLINEARELEEIFRCHQDVEWTIRNDELYILQSRPITTFKYKCNTNVSWQINDKNVENTWTLYYQEPYTPLTQDLLHIYNEGRIEGMIESAKAKGFDIKLLNGYAYYHLVPRDMEKREIYRERLALMNSKGQNIFQDVVLPQLQQYRKELSTFDKRFLEINELTKYLKKSIDFFQKANYLHILAVDGSMYLEEFKKYSLGIIPDISEKDFYDLVFQKSTLSVERERVLELAVFVKSKDELVELFKSCLYDEILYKHLVRYKSGITLLKKISDYLHIYGMLSFKGIGHIAPEILKEKPWGVISKIRVSMDMSSDIYCESLNKLLLNKKRIIKDIYKLLNDAESKDFTKKLRAAEKAFLVNDDHCFYIDLTSQGYLRLALLKAGGIFTERKIIEQLEDIYFLKLDEIYGILRGKILELDIKIRERKEIHKNNMKLLPPEYLGKSPECRTDEMGAQKDELKGVSGLYKRVVGRVKVIKDITKYHEIKEAYILVLTNGHGCYFLPIMNRIKGIIYDEGSPFDHPGILAREFEIPSIYKTGNATKVLKDGDLVELDGVSGVVRIIERA